MSHHDQDYLKGPVQYKNKCVFILPSVARGLPARLPWRVGSAFAFRSEGARARLPWREGSALAFRSKRAPRLPSIGRELCARLQWSEGSALAFQGVLTLVCAVMKFWTWVSCPSAQ